jgi:HPt (histidine-containing phosphotransfer) domain-containing protein
MSASEQDRDAALERLAAVRRRFGARLRDRIAELEACIASVRDGRTPTSDAIVLAHRLAGTAGSFGYVEAGQEAAAIELLLRRHDQGHDETTSLPDHLARLRELVSA